MAREVGDVQLPAVAAERHVHRIEAKRHLAAQRKPAVGADRVSTDHPVSGRRIYLRQIGDVEPAAVGTDRRALGEGAGLERRSRHRHELAHGADPEPVHVRLPGLLLVGHIQESAIRRDDDTVPRDADLRAGHLVA
nr:hypothetical protein [Allorhizocola rhizosphaerae]